MATATKKITRGAGKARGNKKSDTGVKLEGMAKATQTPSGGKEAVEVGRMAQNNYFGERSLLTREPRAANVVALTPMRCVCLDRSAFERLLGPLKDIMKLHAAKYARAEDVIKAQKSPGAAAAGGAAAPASSSSQ